MMVYYPHMSWARPVAHDAGVPTAAFMSQSSRPGTPRFIWWIVPLCDAALWSEDLSPFVVSPELYPKYLDVSIRQFEGLEEVDDMLSQTRHYILLCFLMHPQKHLNTELLMYAYDLQTEQESAYMESMWRAKTAGPLLHHSLWTTTAYH